MSVHGMDAIAFDDYRIPAWIWKRLIVCAETGCWEWNGGAADRPWRVMAMRLLNVERDDIFGLVQTCANDRCARPEHLCVTLHK